jgi:hypothetical protein
MLKVQHVNGRFQMRLIGAIILLLLGTTGCCVPKMFWDDAPSG